MGDLNDDLNDPDSSNVFKIFLDQDNNYKFTGNYGYIKRKYVKFIDKFAAKKLFLSEIKKRLKYEK